MESGRQHPSVFVSDCCICLYESLITVFLAKCQYQCLHSGICSSPNRCRCTHGWEGQRCHKPVCTLPCLNGGYCVAPYTCECKAGWSGTRCQERELLKSFYMAFIHCNFLGTGSQCMLCYSMLNVLATS